MLASQRLKDAATTALASGSVSASAEPSEPTGQPNAPARVAGVIDHEIAPLPQAIEAAEVKLLLRADGPVGLALDDCADQRRLVLEVVVELRAAHLCTVAHFLDRRAGNALLKDQLRRSVNDPRARLLALARQPRPIRTP